jgi:hypothetical protein
MAVKNCLTLLKSVILFSVAKNQAKEAVEQRAKPLSLQLLKNVAIDWGASDRWLPKIVHLIH